MYIVEGIALRWTNGDAQKQWPHKSGASAGSSRKQDTGPEPQTIYLMVSLLWFMVPQGYLQLPKTGECTTQIA